MREYMTPDFDVTVYEIEDVITVSVDNILDKDTNNGDGWWN